jgi:hypothetical protein
LIAVQHNVLASSPARPRPRVCEGDAVEEGGRLDHQPLAEPHEPRVGVFIGFAVESCAFPVPQYDHGVPVGVDPANVRRFKRPRLREPSAEGTEHFPDELVLASEGLRYLRTADDCPPEVVGEQVGYVAGAFLPVAKRLLGPLPVTRLVHGLFHSGPPSRAHPTLFSGVRGRRILRSSPCSRSALASYEVSFTWMLYSSISVIRPSLTTYFCAHSFRNGFPVAFTVPDSKPITTTVSFSVTNSPG